MFIKHKSPFFPTLPGLQENELCCGDRKQESPLETHGTAVGTGAPLQHGRKCNNSGYSGVKMDKSRHSEQVVAIS